MRDLHYKDVLHQACGTDALDRFQTLTHSLDKQLLASLSSNQQAHSLSQVSTRSRDFVVDTLALRARMQRCNEWTTDPEIVKVRRLCSEATPRMYPTCPPSRPCKRVPKPVASCQVFHGADSDIVWLQKDFSVYIVNLFDTGQVRMAATRIPVFRDHNCN